MFSSKGSFSNIVSESKRRTQLDEALQEHVQAISRFGAISERQSVRSIIERSHIALEEAVYATGRVPRRGVSESLHTYLLETVAKEVPSTQLPQYRDRMQTYIRLYELAAYGQGALTLDDLDRVREEILFVEDMCYGLR